MDQGKKDLMKTIVTKGASRKLQGLVFAVKIATTNIG